MSSHSFARTLMDETGYCAGGRWRGCLPLGVSSPIDRMAQGCFGLSHGEAALAVEPGAREEIPVFRFVAPAALSCEGARWTRCIDYGRDWTCIRRRSWPAGGLCPAERFDRSWGGSRARRRAFWRCRRGWRRPCGVPTRVPRDLNGKRDFARATH
jgi:hypothetical protein